MTVLFGWYKLVNMRRVYLDVCALNRPFDDQRQMRVRLETDAVLLILNYVETRALELAVSQTHWFEIAASPNQEARRHVESLLQRHGVIVAVEISDVRSRAEELYATGFGPADAAHVAYAEAMDANFISVDDKLLRSCYRSNIRVWCGKPAAFCDKENLR